MVGDMMGTPVSIVMGRRVVERVQRDSIIVQSDFDTTQVFGQKIVNQGE